MGSSGRCRTLPVCRLVLLGRGRRRTPLPTGREPHFGKGRLVPPTWQTSVGRTSLQDVRKATPCPLLPAAVLENRNSGLIKSASACGLIPGPDTAVCVGPSPVCMMKVRGVVPPLLPRSPHNLSECLWRHRNDCKCNFQKLLGGFRSLVEIFGLQPLSCPVSMSLEL